VASVGACKTILHNPGALPGAALIVRINGMIGEGLKMALTNHDPTSHSEVEAIRDEGSMIGDGLGCQVGCLRADRKMPETQL
jgi:tRNA(Arg) A34 adenosine deaminase TadA